MLIEPKEVEIADSKGVARKFIFSKFDAVSGREIVAQYPVALMPKLGDYKVSEAMMLKVLGFVAVNIEGRETPLQLSTRELVNNHCGDWETLAKVEMGMMEYNCSFFGNGKTSDFFGSIVQTLKAWITSTLMDLSAASSAQGKPRSTNSARSTHLKTRSRSTKRS